MEVAPGAAMTEWSAGTEMIVNRKHEPEECPDKACESLIACNALVALETIHHEPQATSQHLGSF